jgi:benzoyl-CoA reductase/2-hydroxyglutaryl-CoA dehydratase subunit BcrC/BadD/HgdB
MLENQRVSEVIAYIRTVKEAAKKVYGIMAHGLVPEELIYAAGDFPLRLSLAGDKTSATKGIEYLTSATCSFARSTLGYFELQNELYKEIDAIVAGNYCNGELCATEMISQYFQIPSINIVFPSTKNEFALKFMVAELAHFKEEIERFAGTEITQDRLSEAISVYNEERKLIQEVVKIQKEREFPLSGVECLELLYKHFLYGVESSIENLRNILSELQEKSASIGREKIIFIGNGVPIGDNILQLIEDNGFWVIENLTWTGLDYYQSLVKENTIKSLAEFYINAENSGRMILSDNYFEDLIKIYEESHADGIIFYTIKYCSIFPSVISTKLKQTLSDQKIPYLEIGRDYGVTPDAQLQTQLQAFKEMFE